MTPYLRKATEADIKDILEIELLSFSDPWSENSFRIFLNSACSFTVLTNGEKVIGYSVLGLECEDFAELYNIAIHPDHRKKGLSALLMQELTDTAKAHKKDKILLEVRASNAPAIALYEKFGFKTDGVRKNYYINPSEDGILMSLNIQ